MLTPLLHPESPPSTLRCVWPNLGGPSLVGGSFAGWSCPCSGEWGLPAIPPAARGPLCLPTLGEWGKPPCPPPPASQVGMQRGAEHGTLAAAGDGG